MRSYIDACLSSAVRIAKRFGAVLTSVFVSVFVLASVLLLCAVPAFADTESWENPDTGYEAAVTDLADILTDSEERELLEKLKPLTAYGNMEFLSVSENPSSAQAFNESYYYEKYGNASGVILLIDLDNRNIIITSAGEAYQVITIQKANTITDNIYQFASGGRYFECAAEAFSEAGSLLAGGKIAEPMRILCSVLLALVGGLLIGFLIVRATSFLNKDNPRTQIPTTKFSLDHSRGMTRWVYTSRRYSPQSSDSGSSGGSSGGGGGGGGGFSGGSGGHSF